MHGGETPATHLGFLTPPSGGEEAVLALGVALVVALLFPRWTPLQAVAIAAGMAVLILFVTLVVFLRFGRVLPWVSLAGLQMVAAVAASFLPLKRVFISYRIVDGLPVAQNISRGLKTRGVETFLDIDEDRSGGISAVVRSEIARSSCVLLILTPGVYTASRLDGDHVIAELDAARDSGRPVLPVWVDDVAGHLRLWQAKGHKLPPSLAKVADGQVRAEYQSALSEESIARLEMKIPASRRRAKRVPNLQSTVRPGIA